MGRYSGNLADPRRRRFLQQAITASAGITLGFPSIIRGQEQDVWGEIEEEAEIWDSNYQPKNILELFCYGGLSQWENFWVNVDANGNPDWRNFENAVTSSEWMCAPLDTIQGSNTQTKRFGYDQQGNEVHWGPATQPLWHEDIIKRARMVVMSHDFNPHEVAVPYAVTGTTLGNPRHAGLGAAIQRRNQALVPRATPYAYCIMPPRLGGFRIVRQSAMATGAHEGNPRPLLITLGSTSLIENLNRQVSAQNDSLLNHYAGAYRDRLRWHGAGDPVRSVGFDAYAGSLASLFGASSLSGLFPEGILDVDDTSPCLGHVTQIDPVANPAVPALNLARQLLTQGNARHVFVADGGLREPGKGFTYDTHSTGVDDMNEHVRRTSSGVYNLLSSLAQQIDPTGTDSDKINLEDTMIVIHTEFGRSPNPENDPDGDNDGRGHWPYGFATVLIGGPIPVTDANDSSSNRIAGSINPTNGLANGSGRFNASDVRAACMLAAGIRPFEGELFAVADMSDSLNEGDEILNMREFKSRILGIPV